MPSGYPGTLDNLVPQGTKVPVLLQAILDGINRLQVIHRLSFMVSAPAIVAGVCQTNLPTHGLYHQLTLTQRTTYSGPTNPRPGVQITVEVTQDVNGGWDIVWDSTFNVSPPAPTGAHTPGAVTTYTWKYNGTKWMLVSPPTVT